jgi:hypothetical protein
MLLTILIVHKNTEKRKKEKEKEGKAAKTVTLP